MWTPKLAFLLNVEPDVPMLDHIPILSGHFRAIPWSTTTPHFMTAVRSTPQGHGKNDHCMLIDGVLFDLSTIHVKSESSVTPCGRGGGGGEVASCGKRWVCPRGGNSYSSLAVHSSHVVPTRDLKQAHGQGISIGSGYTPTDVHEYRHARLHEEKASPEEGRADRKEQHCEGGRANRSTPKRRARTDEPQQ